MRPGMTSRMRKSRTQHRQGLLFYFVLGLLLNIAIAYICGGIAGAMGFHHHDNGHGNWDLYVESENGWASTGTTYGVSGWRDDSYIEAPIDMFTVENGLTQEGGTRQTTMTWGTQIGWPLRSIQKSESMIEVKTYGPKAVNARRTITEINTDITPTPHWYFKGINTKLKNNVLWRIPVQIRPLQFTLNTLFYSVGAFAIHLLIVRLKQFRRKRRGLCVACGYAVEDFKVCPECGSDHAAC